jgi:hypothetical protein
MKTIFQVLTLTPLLSMIVIGLSQSTLNAISISQDLANFQSPNRVPLEIQFMPPPLPPRRGLPSGNREEAGSRSGGNAANAQRLTALVPEHPDFIFGKTVSDRPSFWFYVPYSPEQIETIQFVLQNEHEKTITEMDVLKPTTPGIMQIRLPDQTPALEVNRFYRWFFKIKLAHSNRQQPRRPREWRYVEGLIQRVRESSSMTESHGGDRTSSSQLRRAEHYASLGIWYDALTLLAELRIAHPADRQIDRYWRELLQTVELENLADQEIVTP